MTTIRDMQQLQRPESQHSMGIPETERKGKSSRWPIDWLMFFFF